PLQDPWRSLLRFSLPHAWPPPLSPWPRLASAPVSPPPPAACSRSAPPSRQSPSRESLAETPFSPPGPSLLLRLSMTLRSLLTRQPVRQRSGCSGRIARTLRRRFASGSPRRGGSARG
ncbi:unnamed protein product, partial [Ectocarpus sp. 12 AP-2014]